MLETKKGIARQPATSTRHLKGIYEDFLYWDALCIYCLEREGKKKKKRKENKEKGR